MDAALSVARVRSIQAAFQVLAMLQMTAIYWPQQATVKDGARYSYIIVGGGSAGCVLANRLSEQDSNRVLLIEAGGDPPFETMVPGLMDYIPQTPQDWNYTDAGDNNRALYQNNLVLQLTQAKMLGGGSSANYMLYVRGNPHDFNTWADAVGDRSWDYDHVLPYFKKSEDMQDPIILRSDYKDFHGTKGLLPVTRNPQKEVGPYRPMFNGLGNDIRIYINGNETLAYGDPTYTISKGLRQSTAYAFLRPVKDRRNLHVLKLSEVTRILFDELKNAIGVEVLTEQRELITIMAEKEIIVTAGGINSAKLLLLSGVGPQDHLESQGITVISDLPVGLNLEDHTAALVAYKFKKSNAPPKPLNYTQFLLPSLVGYVALDKYQTYPDYQSICYVIANGSDAALTMCSFNFGIDLETCQAIYEAGKKREILFCVQDLLHPKSRGKIELQSTNPEDPPLVSLGAYSEEDDINIMARAFEKLDRVRTSTYYKSVGGGIIDHRLPKCQGLAFGSREYWRCHVLSTTSRFSMYDYSGACGMGRVVDSRLRVLGVQRLRVADSSSMPSITSGNLNAAVIMIAEKAADMIKEDNTV